MKRIGLPIDTLIGGGASSAAPNFPERFAACGHDMHMILVKRKNRDCPEICARGIPGDRESASHARRTWKRRKETSAGPAQPSIPKDLVKPLVTGAMTPEGLKAMFRALKKAVRER